MKFLPRSFKELTFLFGKIAHIHRLASNSFSELVHLTLEPFDLKQQTY